MTPSDLFNNSVQSILNTIHTALPAKIISYDHTQNKAIVQPLLNKAYKNGIVSMPILNDIPIIFPKYMFFPILEGDNVLLVFCERSIDLWKQVGSQVTPDDPRKFNLSDAVAIPILQPFNADYSQNNGQDFIINYAGSSVTIKDNGDVLIQTSSKIALGTQTIELLQQISDTLAEISSITTTIPAGSSMGIYPIDNAGMFTAIQLNIDSIKGAI